MSKFIEIESFFGHKRHFVNVDHIIKISEGGESTSVINIATTNQAVAILEVDEKYEELKARLTEATA